MGSVIEVLIKVKISGSNPRPDEKLEDQKILPEVLYTNEVGVLVLKNVSF